MIILYDISIVIPLFNKSSYIKRTINSVINQTYKNFEIIVVDDGSTDDGVEKILTISDDRIKLIRQKNQGVSMARNNGIISAKAETIAFLDADDEWDCNFLQEVINLRNKYKNIEIISLAYKMKMPSGELKSLNYDLIPNESWDGIIENYFKSCIPNDLLHSSSTVISKKVFYDVGFFPEEIQFQEDLDMWGRIAFKYKIVYSNKSWAIYNIGITNSLSKIIIERDAPIFNNTKNYSDKYNINNIDLFYFNEYVALHKIANAYSYLNNYKNKGKCKKLLIETMSTKLFKKMWFKTFVIYLLPNIIYITLKKFKRIGAGI